MRILGIDYGRRRLGLALSDEEAILASPLPTRIRGRSEARDVAGLSALVVQYGVSEIVVGWPVNMDGSRGEMAAEAEAFAARVAEATGCPVELFDERLTSNEAERVLLDADFSRRRRRQLRDSLAAVLILQGHLDRRGLSDRPSGPERKPTPSSPPA